MSYLVDAKVLSESTYKKPDKRVLTWLEEHEAQLHVSVLTLGELQKGISLYPESRKRAALEKWFKEVLEVFSGRVLPVDQAVALAWGKYYAAQQQAGRKPPALDSLVAATAWVHGFTVVSRNTDDSPGVPVVNPWASATV
ncbi:MAG: type II toxin-antitoxin system VapC family toxin [Verrucomicrobia bacterium]|nr:type II toxin-antitoxin system VapC family toxin [Verrucomicrobiota bacterium]